MPYVNAFRSPRPIILLLAACTVLGGCATTSFKNSNPSYVMQAEPQALPAAVEGTARVAVRWTQVISPAAQDVLRTSWVSRYNDIVFQNPVSLSSSNSRPNAYLEMPSDSTYYAAEFARLLSRRIPSADVVLEPLALDAHDGKLVYKSLVRNRFPAQIVVDMWTVPLTHVNVSGIATIVYSISTSGLASPASCGVLGVKPGRNITPAFDATDCGQYEARDVPHPDLIYGFQGEEYTLATTLPLKHGVPLAPGQAVDFPQTYEQFTSEYIAASGAPKFDAGKDLANPTLEELAKVVADGLGRLDPALSVRAGWNRYVALYDASLAQRLQAGALEPEDTGKIRLIAKLADAERAWVVAQDQTVLKNLLDGEFGTSFRATRLAMDKQYSKQLLMGWAAALSMAGTATMNAALAPGASMARMQNSLTSMQTAVQYQADSARSSAEFYQKFGSELAGRNQVTEIDYGGKVIHVQAENLGKLYAELDKIYQASFPGGATKAAPAANSKTPAKKVTTAD